MLARDRLGQGFDFGGEIDVPHQSPLRRFSDPAHIRSANPFPGLNRLQPYRRGNHDCVNAPACIFECICFG